MRRLGSLTSFVIALSLFVLACGQSTPQATPQPATEHALSGLAALHVALLPTSAIRVDPRLNWSIGVPTELQRTLDADIKAAFEDRDIAKDWIYPEALAESYRKNPTYGTDPYRLAMEPLRAPTLGVNARLPEPIASQVRTLVALHDDVRLVLAPVELRLEPVVPRGGRGVLRLVLMDARLSSVRWIGDIESDQMNDFGPRLTASIAARLAGVVAPR